jgi:hypothetical protein
MPSTDRGEFRTQLYPFGFAVSSKTPFRFGFRRDWDTTSMFIVNLALCDLLYCAFSTPFFVIQTLSPKPLSRVACRIFLYGRWAIGIADSTSLAMVAFTRCFSLLQPEVCKRVFSGKAGVLIIMTVWIYVFSAMSPGFFGVLGVYGYHCMSGTCNFIPTGPFNPEHYYLALRVYIPSVVVIVSYIVLWKTVKVSSKFLKQSRLDIIQGLHIYERKLGINSLVPVSATP